MKRSSKDGAPTILDKAGITEEEFIELYYEAPTTQDLANKLGCTKRSIRNYVSKLALPRKSKPTAKSTHINRFHLGEFAQWMKENPQVVLPRSSKEIAELTGIERNKIDTYLSRRRRLIRKRIRKLPNRLPPHPDGYTTKGGQVYPAEALTEGTWSLDPWAYKVDFTCHIRGGGPQPIQIRKTIEDWEALLT